MVVLLQGTSPKCGTSEAHRTAQAETVFDSQGPSIYAETCDFCPRNSALMSGTASCGCLSGFGFNDMHSSAAEIVANHGLDCWDQCGAAQGPCSFCGIGYCCRYGWEDTSNGCDGSVGIPEAGHVCSHPPPSSPCQSCVPGKYSASIGNDPCIFCPAGKYSQGMGATTCLDCG